METVQKLSNIIDASLQEKSLDKLNDYLASLHNPTELLNGKFILALSKILRKPGKQEDKKLQLTCVTTFLQYFLNKVPDVQKWGKVSEDMSKLCELLFVISSSFIKEDTVIQKVVNLISAIAENVDSVADDMLKFLAKTLLDSCLCVQHSKYTRLVIMVLIGSLLQKSSRRIRNEILPSTIDHLNNLSNFLSDSDDYETQVSIVEILARSLIFIDLKHQKSLFTNNRKIREIFKKYQPFLNFDPDCRLFLNEVNQSLGDQQKVFSVPCMVVSANDARLKKPNDPAYSGFWVDFNLGSRSVSFYYQMSNSDSWELMTIPEDNVISAVAKDSTCQSRSGEKFEAVKLELTIDSSDLSPNSELPQKVKIYPQKEVFSRIECVVQQIFNEKYKTEVMPSEKTRSQATSPWNRSQKPSDDANKLIGSLPEKSFFETSALSKLSNDGKEDSRDIDKSKTGRFSLSSKGDDEAEEDEGSPYSKYIKEKMLEKSKNETLANRSQSDEKEEITKNYEKPNNKKSDSPENEKTSLRKNTDLNLPHGEVNVLSKKGSNEHNKPYSRTMSLSVKSLDSAIDEEQKKTSAREACLKVDINKKRKNNSELNNVTKKKRLYSFEKSNAEDVVMSSQDQALLVEIPSYKITRKETFTKPQPSKNRRNISYSYINNREKEKVAMKTESKRQKQFNFEDDVETHQSLSNDDSSEDGNELSPQIFKDSYAKPKASGKIGLSEKCFYKNPYKDVDLDKAVENPHPRNSFRLHSAYSDFSSPERKPLKSRNTYSRKNPIRRCKRNRVMVIESSDSDSQYESPSKQLKEDGKDDEKLTPTKTSFAASIGKTKIDPIRDNVYVNEMKLETAFDLEEPALKTRDIVAEIIKKPRKAAEKTAIKGKIPQKAKNTNACKKKTTKQTTKQNIGSIKKPEPKKPNEDLIEQLSESLTDCMDIIHFEPHEDSSPLYCEDLALDILRCNENQKTILHSTFKVNDMIRFGKLLMKQIQAKLVKAEKLAQKEREMNFATFDYKVQASCSGLYGSSQRMESITDKLDKLNTMLQATYKLHKEIATQVNSEVLKIEEAKNELLKNVNKTKKTETSIIPTIFQEVGGYLKKLVLSFIQGDPKKTAITN